MSVIEEVKQKTDIVEVISQYTKLVKAGRMLKGLCPFHSEKHGSFFVYPEQQNWHCFGACNTGGDVFSFIMKKENLTFGEALKSLAERAGVEIPVYAEPQAEKDAKEKLHQANDAAALFYHNLLLNSPAAESARQYAAGRNLDQKALAAFQLGYSPSGRQELKKYMEENGYTKSELIEAGLLIKAEDGHVFDRFHNKLMFPIADGKGRINGFGSRNMTGSGPKYINSPQTALFDKSSLLYGLHLASSAIRQQDNAIIVEGYTDAITAHQHGFQNVVASMGTAVTERQIYTLKKLTHNVIFALDADTAGQEATLRSVVYENILSAEIKVVVMPEGKDPDNVIRESKEDWEKLIGQARPLIDFIFDHFTPQFDLETASGKSGLTEKLMPIIADIKDTVRQAHYTQKLSRLVNVDEHRLEAAMGQATAAKRGFRTTAAPEPVIKTEAKQDMLEDYCLGLLLRHQELKIASDQLKPEYFTSSQNRQIFNARQQATDAKAIKDALDSAIWPQFDKLAAGEVENQAESRLTMCAARLRERYLRAMATRMEDIMASEEDKGGVSDIIKYQEQLVDEELHEIFIKKGHWHRNQRG